MRILLINPPQSFYPGSLGTVEQLPLGLLYIGATLKKIPGIELVLLDALRECDLVRTEKDISYYGLSWEAIEQKIIELRPAVVAISNQFSTQIKNAIEIARLAKKINPEIITVIGGTHPTVYGPNLLQEESSLDYCLRGEGELSFKNFIVDYLRDRQKTPDQIPGLVYRDQGIVKQAKPHLLIEKLDELPYPAYELIDMEKYLAASYKLSPTNPKHTTRVIEMITSRGCPYECIFCSIHSTMGKGYRTHSAEYVLDHIEYVIKKYKVEHIRFNDDNMSLNQKRFNEILSGIIARKLKFTWDCPNGVRADSLNLSIFTKMKAAGCIHIFVAAESGNQQIVNEVVGKKLDLKAVELALSYAKKVGLATDVYFILGLPGETIQTMRESKNFGLYLQKKYRASPYFFTAMPLPGTRLLSLCREKNYIEAKIRPHELSATGKKVFIHTESFSCDDVLTVLHEADFESQKLRKKQNLLMLFSDPIQFAKKLTNYLGRRFL